MLSKTRSFLALFALLSSFVFPFNSGGKAKTYIVFKERMNWYEAFQVCQDKNLELASMESQEEADQLMEVLTPYGMEEGEINGYWLGGFRPKKATKTFVWANSRRPIKFNLWAPGEPNNDEGNEKCVEIYVEPDTKKWLWNDLPCSNIQIQFVCQAN